MMHRRELRTFLVMIISSLALALAGVVVSADSDDVILQASLSGPSLNSMIPTGHAEQRTSATGSRRFKVEVEDVNLAAGTVLNVLVNGTRVGSLSINSFRQGELELESEHGQAVPNVSAGAIVTVRTEAGATIVSGTFGAASPGTPGVTPTPKTEDKARGTVQFGASSYTVAEDARSLSITVTRTGDISRDSKVDYRSSDVSAHERSDYTTAAGRLFFAPGEGTKTINVLITDDGFKEGDETFNLTLFDASNSTEVGAPGTATVTITDNDTAAAAVNPIDTSRSFIVQHYMDFLNREPEPEGLKAWEEILNKCEAGDDRCDRIEVSSGFFRSPEFQERGSFLYHFYSVSFGRIPHYTEFEKDMSRTSGFQTAAEKEANKALFADDFVTRQEFKDRYDQFTSASDFVNALLNTAGVVLPNKDALAAALQNGQMTFGLKFALWQAV